MDSGYQKFFKQAKRAAEASSPLSPEQMLREQLIERVLERKNDKANNKKNAQKNERQEKKRQAKMRSLRMRSAPPLFASLLLLTAAGSAVVGYFNPRVFDGVEQSAREMVQELGLPKIEIGLFGSASAAEEKKPEANPAPKAAGNSAEPAEKSQDKQAAQDATKGEEANLDVRQWSPEELSFFKKLNEKKAQLDRREAELAKLEEELQKQREGIEEKIKQLDAMRKQISTTLKDRVVQDQEKVAKLVDVYSTMKPAQASKVIETLNEDLAVTILDGMKKKNAAEILNTMSAAKARRLSEMLTGYQVKDEASKEDRKPAGQQN